MAGYTGIGLGTILKTGHSVVKPVDLRAHCSPQDLIRQNIYSPFVRKAHETVRVAGELITAAVMKNRN